MLRQQWIVRQEVVVNPGEHPIFLMQQVAPVGFLSMQQVATSPFLIQEVLEEQRQVAPEAGCLYKTRVSLQSELAVMAMQVDRSHRVPQKVVAEAGVAEASIAQILVQVGVMAPLAPTA